MNLQRCGSLMFAVIAWSVVMAWQEPAWSSSLEIHPRGELNLTTFSFVKVVELSPMSLIDLESLSIHQEVSSGEILLEKHWVGELLFLRTTKRQILVSQTRRWMISGHLKDVFAWESLQPGWLLTRGDETLELP